MIVASVVDQIASDGSLLQDVDTRLSQRRRHELILDALPGATIESYAGVKSVLYEDQLILSKQVTYLGNPWEPYKKRIQLPKEWGAAFAHARYAGLKVRFVGVYHYGDTTIFVDFEPSTYAGNALNNSSAHVLTNDLFQAQTLGQFSRQDKNANSITSVRADEFGAYLRAGYEASPHIEILDRFSEDFLDGTKIEGLAAVQEMHHAGWPDKFQNEWAGFYVEFRLSGYLAEHELTHYMVVQKEKRRGEFDYDLRLLDGHGRLEFYGDLKASNIAVADSPGNDAASFFRCLEAYGRFWYVIYEHETWHARDNEHVATTAWNDWRRSVGHVGRDAVYNPLSYKDRYKEAVRFVRVKVLEVNHANVAIALGDFQRNFRQPDGKPRKGKVMIRKSDIDNFLIYTKSIEVVPTP